MNEKVKAAFIAFALLLMVWVLLAIYAKPELAELLTFVKGATVTAWTAAALFFETNATPNITHEASAPAADSLQPK